MTGVYVASAIDQVDDPSVETMAQALVRWLRNTEGVSWVYDPKAAFEVGRHSPVIGPGIREINAHALEASDVLLAYLPAGTVSIGVPMEIERAISLGLHVVVISDAPSWMLQDPRVHRFTEWNTAARIELGNLLRDQPTRHDPLAADPVQVPMPVTMGDGARLPTRGHADDAGLDLYVSEETIIHPGMFADVPCGVRAELPEWCWGMITGRSSTLRRRGLMVSQGVIDAGYRGELFAGVFNLGAAPVTVGRGERLAQLILLENATARVYPAQAERLNDGSRGDRGFGSTGS